MHAQRTDVRATHPVQLGVGKSMLSVMSDLNSIVFQNPNLKHVLRPLPASRSPLPCCPNLAVIYNTQFLQHNRTKREHTQHNQRKPVRQHNTTQPIYREDSFTTQQTVHCLTHTPRGWGSRWHAVGTLRLLPSSPTTASRTQSGRCKDTPCGRFPAWRVRGGGGDVASLLLLHWLLLLLLLLLTGIVVVIVNGDCCC